MHRRYQARNIPIEVLRTAVAITDLGSFTRAGEELDLSQAAVSAQVKRFESFLGTPAFEREGGRVKLTERGELAILSARRALEANDQILRIGGGGGIDEPLRIGVSVKFSGIFIRNWSELQLDSPVTFYFDHSSQLQKAFISRSIDVACILGEFDGVAGHQQVTWAVDFTWVRAANFVLSPGAPIPIIDWPASLSNDIATRALEGTATPYRFQIRCADFHSSLEAVARGIGLIALPASLVSKPLLVAKEYYLPQLTPARAGIYVRDSVASKRVAPAIDIVKGLMKPAS